MNETIIQYLKNTIREKGMTFIFISKKSGIEYQRLMRIFNQNAIISGAELLHLCKLLDIDLVDLMDLIDESEHRFMLREKCN